MKLLSIVVALSSFLSMTEGANLRSIHKQAPVSKGRESPVVGSLRQQILDDNSDAAWERELKGKKGVKAKKKKGKKDKDKKDKKNKKQKKSKKSKKKSSKGLNKKQKRKCQRNPSYSYCPVQVTATNALQLSTTAPAPSRMLHTHTINGRKLIQDAMDLSPGAVSALETTIENMLDPPLDVTSVTIISITAEFLVTYNVELNLPQGTSESEAQSIVDDAVNDISDEDFQEELSENLNGVDNCGETVSCSELEGATKTVSTLSPSSSPSSSPSKAPTGAPSKAPSSSPSSSPTTPAPTASPSPSGSNSASPSPSPDPLTSSPTTESTSESTPSPSPSIDPLAESTADGFEVIPWENDRYLV